MTDFVLGGTTTGSGGRENARLRLGRGDFGFGNGLNGSWSRSVRPQSILDSCRDIGMVVNEPKPDE